MTISYNTDFDPKTIDMSVEQIRVKDSLFSENFGGQLAAAINILDIENKQVSIENSKFEGNSGSFSVLEETYELPFLRYLTNGTYKLNYYQESFGDQALD